MTDKPDAQQDGQKPRKYVLTLKSGRVHVTDYFDSEEALFRWLNTGAAGIVTATEHIGLFPQDIAKIEFIEE